MRQLWVYSIFVVLLASLAPTAAAEARSIAPDGGTVTVKPSATSLGRMEGQDVRISGKRFKVSGGLFSFDRLADEGGGTIRTRGRMRLRRGRLKVDIRDIQITLAGEVASGRYVNGRLTGVIRGVRYPLGVLISRRYRVSPGRFDGLEWMLSPTLTGNLNRLLQAPAFTNLETFATLVGRDISKLLRFSGGRANLSLSDETRAAFLNAGATITPLSGSGGNGGLSSPFTLPITGQRLDLVTLRGSITLNGGLRFTAPPGGSFGGRESFDMPAATISALEDGYAISGAGLHMFSALEDSDTSLDRSSKTYRHVGLALQFARPAADLIAPALGLTPGELIALPKGRLDIDGTLSAK